MRSDGPGKDSELAARHRGCRVLVVDDNEDSAETLGLLLKVNGHEVHIAHEGQQALQVARAFEPDVVLLDIGLPDISGYEVARRMREQPGLEHVVLVAQTGWGQEENRKQSRAAGFDYHLVKPIDLDLLHTLLAKICSDATGPDT